MNNKRITRNNFFNIFFKKKSQFVGDEKSESVYDTTDKNAMDVDFFIENNMFYKIAQLETSGYKITIKDRARYHEKLSLKMVTDGEKIVKEFLNNGVDLPDKFLAIYLLVTIQSKNSTHDVSMMSALLNIMNKIADGLERSPLNPYVVNKLQDKEFVVYFFRFWLDTGKFHLENIDKKVINKNKFLFFRQSKSKKQLTNDIKKFQTVPYMFSGEDYFRIPLLENCVLDNLDLEHILEMKSLINRQTKYHQHIKTISNQHVKNLKLLDMGQINRINQQLEDVIKHKYEKADSQKKTLLPKDSMNDVTVQKNGQHESDEMPSVALFCLEQIRSKYKLLSEKDIGVDNKKEVDLLMNHSLPLTIEKYLKIDKDFRSDLKNIQGKSAEQLLMESLIAIKESLIAVERDTNEQELKNLSIHNRYIKNVLKK